MPFAMLCELFYCHRILRQKKLIELVMEPADLSKPNCYLPVLLFAWYRMFRRRQISRPLLKTDGRPMLRYGFPLLLSSLPALMSLRFDQIVLATQVSSQRLGIYAAAAAWSTLAVPLASAVGNALLPALAGSTSGDQRKFLPPLLRRMVLLGTLTCAGAAVAAPFCVPLVFGKRFSDAGPVAVVLCLAAAFLCVNAVSGEALRGLGRTRAILFSELAGSVVGVGALFLLLPAFGLIGAGLASVFGYGATAVVLTRSMAVECDESVRALYLPRFSDVSAIFRQVVVTTQSLVNRATN